MITWLKGLVELPFWFRGLVFAAVTAILLFAGLRSQPIPELFVEEDKLHHWIGFLVFACSCRLAFPNVKFHWIAMGVLLTGVLIEAVQGFDAAAHGFALRHAGKYCRRVDGVIDFKVLGALKKARSTKQSVPACCT